MAPGTRQLLTSGWEITHTPPDAVSGPGEALCQLHWLPAPTLGTVAAILRDTGAWNFDTPRRFDAEDWWYRLRFAAADAAADGPRLLGFDGLATIADAWLNGEHLLASDNMFLSHAVPVQLRSETDNELLLRFRALDPLLQARRPRPRWRAPLVEHQQLRWFRTTLLGRIRGWCPPVAPVGPWRPIWLETLRTLDHGTPSLRTRVKDGVGTVEVSCRIEALGEARISAVELVLIRAGERHVVPLQLSQDSPHLFQGQAALPGVTLWWPHTHGEPALYAARLEIQLSGAGPAQISLGHTGFRSIDLDLSGDGFALRVNGRKIFCRGACWTPDIVTLGTDRAAADAALDPFVAAGMNMLRVGGTMVYESDDFLDACDAKGILLWQEFMFANMDYPHDDARFDASVTAECRQLLARISARPCVAVLCGNSECEQQAAMWGAPRERWSQPLFEQLLPRLVAELSPGIAYWPSSAHAGAFPHQANAGTTSYYGIGAYLRPLTDARQAGVRFATECLALANIPEDAGLEAMDGTGGARVGSPLWKTRAPRDASAGWDFDDVRDHYLREVFGLDPLPLRYASHERYVELGRAASGEVMAAAFREWRRARSDCTGALIWFLRDLWPGAGWGILDAQGRPKSAYYFLKRLLQPRAVLLCDEGVNGLYAHLLNDTATSADALLTVSLVLPEGATTTCTPLPVTVPAHAALEVPVASLLDNFWDLTYAYRFGPAPCEAVIATLSGADGRQLGQDFYFPLGHHCLCPSDLGLTATSQRVSATRELVEIRAQKTARFVTVKAHGFTAADQYFHLAPGMPHQVLLESTGDTGRPAGSVQALNGTRPCRIVAGE